MTKKELRKLTKELDLIPFWRGIIWAVTAFIIGAVVTSAGINLNP